MSGADLWLRQAERDLDSARHAAGGGFHALACFQSQQAAEKAVAAYLIERGAERVWGHALADLCEDAMALDKSFDVIKSVAIPARQALHADPLPDRPARRRPGRRL